MEVQKKKMMKFDVTGETNEGEHSAGLPVVSAYNEWDPLEEVIVGVVDGACVPEWHVTLQATMPENMWDFYKKNGGKPFPAEQIEAAKQDLAEFVHILEAEGVTVKRPDTIDHAREFSTLKWQCKGGLYAAMPRDVLLVIGDEIIEAPMCWRSRYYEPVAYRKLIKDYFKKGAKWTAAPKPELCDELFNYDYREADKMEDLEYVITEFEPTFDAADFIRCGKDIVYQNSHVTNEFGVQWLKRHLGDNYRFHELDINDTHPMHIDATIMPLAPGKLLVNKCRVNSLPDMFKNWDILYCPKPCMPEDHTLYMTSRWINMNLISLDHERIIVEKNEESIIKALKDFGFKPIPCSFANFNTFGGSFHCATADIRRRGTLEDYS